MKIYKKELTESKGSKYRLFLVLGKNELEMLIGILRKAYEYFPNSTPYTQENNRLQNMIKVGNKALREWDNL